MSESRRVQLMSSLPPVSEKKQTDKPAPTVRLVVTLEEPTDVSCPEFSYVELVKNATVGAEMAIICSRNRNGYRCYFMRFRHRNAGVWSSCVEKEWGAPMLGQGYLAVDGREVDVENAVFICRLPPFCLPWMARKRRYETGRRGLGISK